MENQTITLELSLDEVNIVLAGLGELPAKSSLSVIDKVRSQAVSQMQKKNDSAEETVTE